MNRTTVPILLVHGWPGSAREYYEFVAKLVKPIDGVDVVFEAIVPSLPGNGWSDAVHSVGFHASHVAIAVRNLMLRLGHSRFVVHGSGWGAALGTIIATIFPDNVIGYHSTRCQVYSALSVTKLAIASVWPTLFVDEEYKHMTFPVGDRFISVLLETGAFHLLATKPDTIGAALENNPVGQAAFILDKFIGSNISNDALIDNLMSFVMTKHFTSSVRLYRETFVRHRDFFKLSRIPTAVPTACARFERDAPAAIDWQLRDKFTNLIQSTYHLNAGHFSALEVPQVLFDDFRSFALKVFKVEN